jgi:hypothetical protein
MRRARRRTPSTTDRGERLVEQYLAATRTTQEAISLDELATAVNEAGGSTLTPALIRKLARKLRAATTSVERSNRLEELAHLADKTANAALKWYLLDVAEASKAKSDDMLRIAAIKHLRSLDFPDRRYEQRLIDWIISRLDIPKSWHREERIYAVSALAKWTDVPRVRAKLLRLAEDETQPEDIRSLALGNFALGDTSGVPAGVIRVCRRLIGDPALGNTPAYVLRCCGVEAPEAEPAAEAPADDAMTEARWLTSQDLSAMLAHLQPGASKPRLLRKLRLLTCACCRHVWSSMTKRESRAAVEVGEQFADGLVDTAKRRATERLVRGDTDEEDAPAADVAATWAIAAETRSEDGFRVAPNAAWAASCASQAVRGRKSEKAFQAALVRDIFGNPFRTTRIAPGWLTWRRRAIPKLAQAAYDERKLPGGELDPKRLAALADALEEAGCADADILGHLRGPGPHVRGCWVLDLLLRKR